MHKSPTPETISAWIALHKTQRQLIEHVEHDLKRDKLPPLSWYDVLLELDKEKSNGLRQYEIGDRTLLNKHNLSRLLDRLEKQKLIKRHICEEDGRGNTIKITSKGAELRELMWKTYSQSIEKYFGSTLTKQQHIQLAELLNTVIRP
jgi:DNA-binding MarR family transcriptional regulator